MKRKKLLIVEDEVAIRTGLVDLFVFHGYEVDVAVDGREALEKFQNGYDLVILDVMLPHVDGFSVCNEIRRCTRELPVVMLTAKSTDEDIVNGLTLGADDYVAKPFSVRELVLRVEAVLRRTSKDVPSERTLVIGGGWEIDTATLSGRRAGDCAPSNTTPGEIIFTRREVEILQYLKRHSDRPVSRDELLAEVWGYKRSGAIETRTVDIHLAKLRKKIELDPKSPQILTTVRGEGYRLMLSANEAHGTSK